MSYRAVTMWTVDCDGPGCKANAQATTDYAGWSEQDSAWDDAEEGDWREIDGQHYCPACVVWDDKADTWVPKAAS
jgi:hypothetical protein